MDFPKGSLNLFLMEIGEPWDNDLRIVVIEGSRGEPTKIDIEGTDLGEGHRMAVTGSSRSFEIYWENYVAYLVRNESYWKAKVGEKPWGSHLERRFDTAFQRYVAETTFANNDYPGPLEHWSLFTQNHIVDVISVGPPRVTTISCLAQPL